MKISNTLIKKMESLPVGKVLDANGNLLSIKESDGSWENWKRDANGNLISIERSTGYWVKWKHDSDGRIVSTTTSNGSIRTQSALKMDI